MTNLDFDLLVELNFETAEVHLDGKVELGRIRIKDRLFWAMGIPVQEGHACYLCWPSTDELDQIDQIRKILSLAYPLYTGIDLENTQLGLIEVLPWEDIPEDWLPEEGTKLSTYIRD